MDKSRNYKSNLIYKAKDGDEESLIELINIYTPKLTLKAKQIIHENTNSSHVVDDEDIKQTVYTSVITAVNKFGSNKSNFISIANSELEKQLKAQIPSDTNSSTLNIGSQANSIDSAINHERKNVDNVGYENITHDKLESKILQDELLKLIEELEPKLKKAFILYYFYEMTLAEVGEVMGVKGSHVGVMIKEADKKLMKQCKYNKLLREKIDELFNIENAMPYHPIVRL